MCQNDLFILCTLLKTELEWKRAKTAYPDFVRANEVELVVMRGPHECSCKSGNQLPCTGSLFIV